MKRTRSQDDLLLTRIETARALNVPAKAISRLIEKGVLEPAKVEGTKQWFYISDISAAAEALEQKLDIVSLAHTALKAYAVATRTERKLDQVLQLLGVRDKPIRLSKTAMMGLYYRCRDILRSDLSDLSVETLMSWAKDLLGIGEEYLILLAFYTKNREPWAPILWAAQRMMESASGAKEKELQSAYAYLDFARRCFRQTAYFYCRFQVGREEADLRFPEAKGNVHETLASLVMLST